MTTIPEVRCPGISCGVYGMESVGDYCGDSIVSRSSLFLMGILAVKSSAMDLPDGGDYSSQWYSD